MGIRETFSLSKAVWSVTFKMMARHPSVLLPFFIKAIFEGLILTVLFYFPRPPFLSIFGPPIKAFFGRNGYSPYLHYPDNFLLLPTLFYYGQIFAMMTVGIVMYGMAMGMVGQAHAHEEEVKIFGNMNRSLRRYFALIGVWLITFILSQVILKSWSFLIIRFMPPTTLAKILLVCGTFPVFLIEALFIYAYASIIIERKKFFGAVKRSFSVTRQVFLTTLVLVFLPRMLDVAGVILRRKFITRINPDFPEITLVILAVIIIITLIADTLVFLSAANMLILKRETEKEVEA